MRTRLAFSLVAVLAVGCGGGSGAGKFDYLFDAQTGPVPTLDTLKGKWAATATGEGVVADLRFVFEDNLITMAAHCTFANNHTASVGIEVVSTIDDPQYFAVQNQTVFGGYVHFLESKSQQAKNGNYFCGFSALAGAQSYYYLGTPQSLFIVDTVQFAMNKLSNL